MIHSEFLADNLDAMDRNGQIGKKNLTKMNINQN